MEGKRPQPRQGGENTKRLRSGASPSETATAADPVEPEKLKNYFFKGLLRVLHDRHISGALPIPISQIPQAFQERWKMVLDVTTVGSTDVADFFRQHPESVQLTEQKDGVILVNLSTKEKAKAERVAAKAGTAAVEAKASAVEVSSSAASPVPDVKDARAQAKGAPARPALPVREGGPSRPPSELKDFLWNLHVVLEVFTKHCGGPFPLKDLQQHYSHYMGHKLAVERFILLDTPSTVGLSKCLQRIPHIVTVKQAGGNFTVTHTQPAGTTHEKLLEADERYRKYLNKTKAPEAKAAGKASPDATPRPAAAAAKPAEPKQVQQASTKMPMPSPPAKAAAKAIGAEGPAPARERLRRLQEATSILTGMQTLIEELQQKHQAAMKLLEEIQQEAPA